jgi:hypothetical protein
MLARYDGFPENVHHTTYFSSAIYIGKLQHAITEAISTLNDGALDTKKIEIASVSDLTVTLEFGIADGNDFTYVNTEEKNRIDKAIKTNPFQLMDFICAIRYQKAIETKKAPLRGDYYMIRLVFGKKLLEARVFHERGSRRITPEEMANLIVDETNDYGKKRLLRPFKAGPKANQESLEPLSTAGPQSVPLSRSHRF